MSSTERRPLRPTEVARAHRLRGELGSWRAVARAMGVSKTTLREKLGLDARGRGECSGPIVGHVAGGATPPPLLNRTRRSAPDAIYDPVRDGEAAAQDLTSSLLGDPPPGRRELLEASAARTAPPETHPNAKYWRL